MAAQFVGGVLEFDAAYKLVLERDSSSRFCFRVPRRVVQDVVDAAAEVNA